MRLAFTEWKHYTKNATERDVTARSGYDVTIENELIWNNRYLHPWNEKIIKEMRDGEVGLGEDKGVISSKGKCKISAAVLSDDRWDIKDMPNPRFGRKTLLPSYLTLGGLVRRKGDDEKTWWFYGTSGKSGACGAMVLVRKMISQRNAAGIMIDGWNIIPGVTTSLFMKNNFVRGRCSSCKNGGEVLFRFH